MTCLRIWPVTFFCFDIGLPYLPHESITVRGCVKYIHDSNTTLNFDLKEFYRGFDMSLCPTHNFCLLWHMHTIFGTWVYYHERMCWIYSWSQYNVDLWPQGQIYKDFDMALCLGTVFFVYWHSPTISGTLVCYHRIKCHIHLWPLYDLDLWPQYQYYIFTMNFCIGKIVFALWHRHTKFNWHMGVSPWDNMLWTIMTCVWP